MNPSPAVTPSTGQTFFPEADTASRLPTKSLSQMDFIRLLVAQMQQQDPFKAADSAQMIQQFTALGNFQSMQQMTRQFERMASLAEGSQAPQYLGRQVELRADADTIVTGIVTRARPGLDGTTLLTVGGREYPAGSVIAFSLPAPRAAEGGN